MTSTILTQSELAGLVSNLVAEGTRVIAPVSGVPEPDQSEYRTIRRLEEADLLASLPRRSLKEFFRPSVDGEGDFTPQLVLGARPCDAAGVVNLDNVMGWEYRDQHWLARRAATTIVSIACPGVDGACFCSAVELGPDSTTGADALLIPLDRPAGPTPAQRQLADAMRRAVDLFLLSSEPYPGAAEEQAASSRFGPLPAIRYLAKPVTPRGAALMRGLGMPLREVTDYKAAEGFVKQARERVTNNLAALRLTRKRRAREADLETRLGIAAADGGQLIGSEFTLLAAAGWSNLGHLPEWLAKNHDHPLWKSFAEKCKGCGTCTAVCSTSPCFDVEEGDDRRGETAEARAGKTEPFQQRVMHKFSIYPRRAQSLLCTGCGRCSRSCAAGMSLPQILGQFLQIADAEPTGSAT
jgi:ferredoxin